MCVCVCVWASTAGLPADCPPPTLFPLNIWAALRFLFFVATLLMCLDVLNVCGGSHAVRWHSIRVEQMKTVSGRLSEAFHCDTFQRTSWLELSTRDPMIRAHEVILFWSVTQQEMLHSAYVKFAASTKKKKKKKLVDRFANWQQQFLSPHWTNSSGDWGGG